MSDDPLILSPAEVTALRDSLLVDRDTDWLRIGREYQAGERRALPSVDLVLGLMREIDALQASVDTVQQLLSELVTGKERES